MTGKYTPPPNYTQVPNALLGKISEGDKCTPGHMADMTESQLKVYLAVCRATFGYHRNDRRLSLSKMMALTGLAKQSVLDAAKSLEEMSLIERELDGGVTLWRVSVCEDNSEVVQNLDQVDNLGSPKFRPEVVQNLDQSGLKFRPPSKKETRKKGKKEESGADAPPARSKTELMDRFINQTNLKLPGRESDRRFWWGSITELLRLTDDNLDRAKSLMDKTIATMRGESLTIATPNSLINPARALLASAPASAKNGHSKAHLANQASLEAIRATEGRSP